MISDPRVETLTSWARSGGQLTDRQAGSLAALEQAPPRAAAAPALAYAASAAYARVPNRGPRDLRAGNRMVGVLSKLGEAGARELVGMRDTVSYRNARRTIDNALSQLERQLHAPSGELEDKFTGVELGAGLRTSVTAGPYRAVLAIGEDLRRVQTTWCDGDTGRELSRRPAGVAQFSDELGAVEDIRRRLRAHVTALRGRLERAMIGGDSWAADEWSARMFRDPLRAAMARRLIWRLESDTPVLALPSADGLCDVTGKRVQINSRDRVSLWHPADEPAVQDGWRRRLEALGVQQPIEQAERQVTLAEPTSARLSFAAGQRAQQRPFRGFLRSRGWDVPYMGRWFFIGEANRQLRRDDPIAVLDVDLDCQSADEPDVIRVGDLRFRSVLGADLDSRIVAPATVSEAARDVLGALAAAPGAEAQPRNRFELR